MRRARLRAGAPSVYFVYMPREKAPTTRAERIARLNDQLRKNPQAHGVLRISPGVAALGEAAVAQALATIARLKRGDFEGYLDPYGERRCAVLWLDGRLAVMRIGYRSAYDETAYADDPADAANTTRVMMIQFWDDDADRALA